MSTSLDAPPASVTGDPSPTVRILAAADDERGLALRARMRDFQAELNAIATAKGAALQASLHPPVSG